MKILISACLIGRDCKYNGGNNFNSELVKLLKVHDIVEICPEVLGGLPTPRPPAEIVNNCVITESGVDVTKEFKCGAMISLEIAQKENPEITILKSKSPSCGNDCVYDGSFSNILIEGHGITAALLDEKGYKVLNEKEAIDYLKER